MQAGYLAFARLTQPIELKRLPPKSGRIRTLFAKNGRLFAFDD